MLCIRFAKKGVAMKKKSLSLLLAFSLLFGIVSAVIPVRSLAATSNAGKIIEADKTPLRLYYDEEVIISWISIY